MRRPSGLTLLSRIAATRPNSVGAEAPPTKQPLHSPAGSRKPLWEGLQARRLRPRSPQTQARPANLSPHRHPRAATAARNPRAGRPPAAAAPVLE
ncbi:DUF6053 domain-containing protein [Lysobacter enzymogenes]|uniref:DUF6053 domain-containing protein n=1 Tax=Lysobacter enzymogenes TaxID=69 RepID=UPI003CCD5196